MNVLITGANGFVGSHIVEYALTQGINVYAAVRASSNTTYLADKRIRLFQMNFSSENSIQKSLDEFYSDFGGIDYIIHNAGITKTLDLKDYEKVNYQLTVNLIRALDNSSHQIKKFTYVSSMAASSPGEGNNPITINQPGNPVSHYGISKKKTESHIEKSCPFKYLILRPPPVFGPRDTDMFTVFQMLSKKIEIYIGGQNQLLSFIYVKDLARGIVESTISNLSNTKYFVSDGNYYDSESFNQKVKEHLQVKSLKISLPLFLVYVVAYISEFVTKITGKVSQLNREKIKELKCPNWMCDSSDFYDDLGIQPIYSLEEGIQETITWYRNNKWL